MSDEDEARHAGVLNSILFAVLVALLLGIAGNVVHGTKQPLVYAVHLAAIVLLLALRVLMRRGRVAWASWGLIVGSAAIVTGLVAVSGTIRSPNTTFYVLIVIVAGLLLSRRAMVASAVLSALAVLGLALAENAGRLPTPHSGVTFTNWTIFSLAIALAAVCVHLALRNLEEALERARRQAAERAKAETSLRRSEEQVRSIFERSADAIVLADEQGIVVEWNRAAEEITGLPRAGVLGRFLWDLQFQLTPREQRSQALYEQTRSSIQQALISGDLPWMDRILEGELLHAGGEHRYFQQIVFVVPAGERFMIGSTIRDLSEQRKVQERLDSSERRYRDFVEQSVEGIWLLSFDEPIPLDLPAEEQVRRIQTSGYVAECNDALARMYGYESSEQLTGVRLLDLYGGRPSEVNFQSTLQLARAGYRSGDRLTEEVNSRGETVYFLNNAVGIVEKGQLLGLWGTQRDITDLKRAEQALRRNEERYRALFERTNDAVFILSLDGRLVEANRQAEDLLGYEREELLEMPMAETVAESEVTNQRDKLRALLAGEPVPVYERIFRRKDGSACPVEIDAALVLDDRGQPLHIQSIVRDISQRRQAEAEIRQLNEVLEQRVEERTAELMSTVAELEAFGYTISHNLRAPLRALNGFANILLQDHSAGLDAGAATYLDRIRVNAGLMGQMIDALLEFLRLGRVPLQTRRVSPADVVRRALEELDTQMADRRIEITVGDLPECEADPTLLRWVYVHLLSNAIKFTRKREPGRIEIGATRQDGQAVYYVRDNGVGFDMRYRNKLFGVFQQLQGPQEYGGTGAGLAIAERIVHRHGGRIWAESAPDQGATFYFTLGEEPQSGPA